jgi:putative ABC transport system permease protein
MGAWWLAWRYVWNNLARTATLVGCVSLVLVLPVLVSRLTRIFEKELIARADGTPLLVGAKGSRYDLVLEALYFEGRGLGTIPAREVDRIMDAGHARAIPLLIRHRARGFAVVGTTLDYFPQRGLRVAAGAMLERLGDCVVGSRVALAESLKPGSELMTDSRNVFDIAGQTPLKMRVRGVLAPSQSPDDDAVFVDIKTAWIIDGIGHGHDDVAKVDPGLLLEKKKGDVKASAGVLSYTEITDANIDSFHFHGDPATFPLSSIIAVPHDERSMSLLLGEYLDPKEPMQVARPGEVMRELLSFVFRAKQFFDAQSLLVGVATLLLLGMVMLLSARLRQREMQTLLKMGAPRGTVVQLFVAEWFYVAVASGIVVAGILAVSLPWGPRVLRYLLFS